MLRTIIIEYDLHFIGFLGGIWWIVAGESLHIRNQYSTNIRTTEPKNTEGFDIACMA